MAAIEFQRKGVRGQPRYRGAAPYEKGDFVRHRNRPFNQGLQLAAHLYVVPISCAEPQAFFRQDLFLYLLQLLISPRMRQLDVMIFACLSRLRAFEMNDFPGYFRHELAELVRIEIVVPLYYRFSAKALFFGPSMAVHTISGMTASLR
jgi:hypothetical protein